MHGRVVIGLLAHVIEERHGSDDFVPARLTVDMFRLPNILTPVEVTTTTLIRDGKRIKVVEAEFGSGGTSMARASCQLLRKTENAPGNVWSPANWARRCRHDPGADRSRARHERQVDDAADRRPHRLARAPAAVDDEVRELVEGAPMSPFVHVATGADFHSPFANAGDQGLQLHQQRRHAVSAPYPVTRWIGFDRVNHHATARHAIGEYSLYDEKGPIRTSTVAALARRKPMTNVPPP